MAANALSVDFFFDDYCSSLGEARSCAFNLIQVGEARYTGRAPLLSLASAVGRDADKQNTLSQQATLTVTGDALPAVYFLLLGLPMVESQGFSAVPAMMNEDVVRELEHM